MRSRTVPPGAVVAAVDGSDRADAAVAWAASVAAKEHRPLVLAHALHLASGWMLPYVVDVQTLNDEIAQGAQELLDELRDRVRADHPAVEVRTVKARDDARDLLIGLSRNAALVVMGSRGRGRVRSVDQRRARSSSSGIGGRARPT